LRRQRAATEQLGGLGSYDWDMVQGRLAWSDELFRIFGEEPGKIEPTYERFLELVVPEDRPRIRAVHENALRSVTPFETEERVRRVDGQVRTLVTNGMVLTDDTGRPVGIQGVCRDVTEQRAADERARRAASRFETLVETSPDAIVVVDRDGAITSVNPQAERLFGHAADELTGLSVDALVPGPARDQHARLRGSFAAHPIARPMAAGTDLEALRADGTLVAVDIALAPLADGSVAVFVRDATQRRQAEHARRRIASAQLRRRQALELNDNVVQGLVALLWEFDDIDVPVSARRSAERTLAAARDMMSDLLDDLSDDDDVLLRTSQVSDETPAAPRSAPVSDGAAKVRIVIADDAPELRAMLRFRLRRLDGVEVVGEGGDGERAIALCEQHEPDIVLLDLSMPELDGLQAAERIRQLIPATRIFVLSGYPASAMRQRALAAGADAYFEKAGDLHELYAAIADATKALEPW